MSASPQAPRAAPQWAKSPERSAFQQKPVEKMAERLTRDQEMVRSLLPSTKYIDTSLRPWVTKQMVCVRFVDKVGHKKQKDKRVIALTPTTLFLCHIVGEVRRYVKMSQVESAVASQTPAGVLQLLIRCSPPEHDMLLNFSFNAKNDKNEPPSTILRKLQLIKELRGELFPVEQRRGDLYPLARLAKTQAYITPKRRLDQAKLTPQSQAYDPEFLEGPPSSAVDRQQDAFEDETRTQPIYDDPLNQEMFTPPSHRHPPDPRAKGKSNMKQEARTLGKSLGPMGEDKFRPEPPSRLAPFSHTKQQSPALSARGPPSSNHPSNTFGASAVDAAFVQNDQWQGQPAPSFAAAQHPPDTPSYASGPINLNRQMSRPLSPLLSERSGMSNTANYLGPSHSPLYPQQHAHVLTRGGSASPIHIRSQQQLAPAPSGQPASLASYGTAAHGQPATRTVSFSYTTPAAVVSHELSAEDASAAEARKWDVRSAAVDRFGGPRPEDLGSISATRSASPTATREGYGGVGSEHIEIADD
ncbi:hypothetical protein DIPPA_01038 [Diplonema papillatum]|nr:hypothetical protein DIPPA_01038 [Diplonema papillatum]|eukprot:gene19227-29611_t